MHGARAESPQSVSPSAAATRPEGTLPKCRSGRPEQPRRTPSAAEPLRHRTDQAQRQRIQQSHSVTGLAASGQFLVAASGQISMTVNTQRSPGRQQPWRVRREITVPQGDTHARRRMAMRGAERVCGPDRVPSMIFPRAGRPAGGPPDNGRNRGDKRFGGPLIRPGRCPLYRRYVIQLM